MQVQELLELPRDEMVRAITVMKIQHETMKSALVQIASMTDPDDMETDDDGLTEWGCEINDAVHMSYENAITVAQMALGNITE